MADPSTPWSAPPAPRKSHTLRNVLIIVAVLVVGMGACAAIVANVGEDAVEDAQKKVGSTTPGGDLIVISLDEFNQIQNGMTVEQVDGIIGGPGKVSSSSQIGDSEHVNYQWAGKGLGDNAIISFQDGIVVAKTQIGLG
jgi:hypothetical protein